MAINIYSLNDLQEHLMESTCPCNPSVIFENGEMIICHNFFDQREVIEEVNEILNKNKR
jgi:hypothetical protein